MLDVRQLGQGSRVRGVLEFIEKKKGSKDSRIRGSKGSRIPRKNKRGLRQAKSEKTKDPRVPGFE